MEQIMNSKQRAAMQQALEALIWGDTYVGAERKQEVINALRAALAEKPAEQLTDEEIDALELPPSGTATVRDLVRLIERAHNIGVSE